MEYSRVFQISLTAAKHSYSSSRPDVLSQLQTWYSEGGYTNPTKFRSALKKIGYDCPILILDGVSGKLVIKAGCVFVTFNTRPVLTDLDEVQKAYYRGDVVYLGMCGDGGSVYATYDSHASQTYYSSPDGTSYPLQYWIAFGEFCSECGAPFVSVQGTQICNSCATVNEPMPYSARAEEELGHEDTQDHKFGIELEYEGVTARQVKKTIPKHAIAKRDGTINNGVEVVTRPACASTHKKEMLPFFDAVKTTSAPNTGMHIHIDKRGLSQYKVGFMLWFFNHPGNSRVLTIIAGRDFAENRYCRTTGATMTSHLRVGRTFKDVYRGATDKYTPFNTAKSATYEVRIFRSPESHLEMCAKLDFLKALMDYSSPYSVSVKSLKEKVDINNFLDFVKKNRKDYPDFYQYFKSTLLAI